MIKFKATTKRGELIGIGLTEKNIEQLKLGRPINVWGAEWDTPFDLLLFYGKDEKTVAAELRKAGLIDPEKTVVHDTSDKPKSRQ